MAWKQILFEGDAAALSDVAPVDADFAAADKGVAATASRRDHKHDMPEGAVGNMLPLTGAAAALGTVNAVSHVDHRHMLGPLTVSFDHNQYQAQSLVLHQAAAAPGAPVDGQIYFDTVLDHAYIYQA